MIICTNCNHQNPEGSVQCENCYAPLPKTSPCPNCGTFTQINAAFCGQCGYNLLSEEPLSLSEFELNSEDFLEPKDTITPEAENSELKNPWNADPGEPENIPLTPISNLEEELAEPEELAFDSNSEEEIFEPDLDSELDLDLDLDSELPEMSDIEELEETIARSAAEMAEIADPLSPEAIDEPTEAAENLVELAESDFAPSSEEDIFEPDLDPDFDIDIEAELPVMPNIDELEETTARSVAEISSSEELEVTNPELEIAAENRAIAEPELSELEELEELEVTNPELEIAAENKAIAEPELSELEELEELEVTNPELEIAAENKAIAEPELSELEELEELEVTNPELEIAAENRAIAEPKLSELEELEVTNPELETPVEPAPSVASKIAAISNPISLSHPLKPVSGSATQLQLERIILSHVQTGADIEIPQNLDIIRIGKPNNQIPPDIDVSDLPDANIVSRVHANIRVEGDNYFIEDAGSSNGTYINHKPLLSGNRHLLRFGDRVSLGKGDLMTFIFKIIEE